MMNGGQEFPPTFSQDDKFFLRLPSSRDHKRYDSTKQVGGEASFRVLYYGGAAGSVPFLWESQPGTPKHKLSDGPLPPLTPPPQYQSSPLASPSLKKKQNSKIFNSIFARKKISSPTSPPSSSSSYSSSYSLPSTPFHSGKESQKARLSSIRFELEEDHEYEVGRLSPTSTLCFRATSGNSCRKSRAYYGYPMTSMKKVVKSIAGRRQF